MHFFVDIGVQPSLMLHFIKNIECSPVAKKQKTNLWINSEMIATNVTTFPLKSSSAAMI